MAPDGDLAWSLDTTRRYPHELDTNRDCITKRLSEIEVRLLRDMDSAMKSFFNFLMELLSRS